MAKIRERNDRLLADSAHLANHALGVLSRHDRHRQHHELKLVGAKHIEALLDVLLNDINPSRGASQHLRIVNLHPVAAAMTLTRQPVEQGTVTAPQIQHPGITTDPGRNLLQVGSQQAAR